MMSVGMLELIKGFLCVVEFSNIELHMIFLEISVCILMACIATRVQNENIPKVNIRCGLSSRNI